MHTRTSRSDLTAAALEKIEQPALFESTRQRCLQGSLRMTFFERETTALEKVGLWKYKKNLRIQPNKAVSTIPHENREHETTPTCTCVTKTNHKQARAFPRLSNEIRIAIIMPHTRLSGKIVSKPTPLPLTNTPTQGRLRLHSGGWR